jgi:hypothetical protein
MAVRHTPVAPTSVAGCPIGTQRKEGEPMRMKTIQALLMAARLTRRILDVQMPMRAIHGLRTR